MNIGPQVNEGSPPGKKGPYVAKDAIPGTPIDVTGFDPADKIAQLRATPGMTNRTLEERFPANPFPGNNTSTNTEVSAGDTADRDTMPIQSAGYMRIAMISLGLLGVI